VLELLKAVRHHADVALATGEEGFLTDRARELGIAVFLIDDLAVPICWRKDTKAVWQIGRLLMQMRPDLVHLHSSKAGMLEPVNDFNAHLWWIDPELFTMEHGESWRGWVSERCER
jgi:hypothetical protein